MAAIVWKRLRSLLPRDRLWRLFIDERGRRPPVGGPRIYRATRGIIALFGFVLLALALYTLGVGGAALSSGGPWASVAAGLAIFLALVVGTFGLAVWALHRASAVFPRVTGAVLSGVGVYALSVGLLFPQKYAQSQFLVAGGILLFMGVVFLITGFGFSRTGRHRPARKTAELPDTAPGPVTDPKPPV